VNGEPRKQLHFELTADGEAVYSEDWFQGLWLYKKQPNEAWILNTAGFHKEYALQMLERLVTHLKENGTEGMVEVAY